MRHVVAVGLMEARLFWRNPQVAFWTFLFPPFLLVLFGSVFGQSPGYMAQLLPGVFSMVLASTAYYGVGVAIAQYRASGFLKRLALVPIPTWQYVVGHVLARCAVVVGVGAELLIIGAGVMRAPLGFDPLTLALVLAVGIPALSVTGLGVGMLARSVEGANAMASFLFFPMVFLSGAYFPVAAMPPVLQRLSEVLPLTPFLRGLRAAYAGLAPAAVVADTVLLAGWGLLGVFVAVRWFRWTT